MELLNRRMFLTNILLTLLSIILVQTEPDHPRDYHGNLFPDRDGKSSDRQGRLFSLFSIVQFKNDPCATSVTLPSGGGRRNGTCFTASECSSKGGSAQGGCAAGFGVCCLFVASESSATVNQNCTYIQNPGFPSPYAETTSISYTIDKCSSEVCYLRLDFETFSLLGIGNTADVDTNTVIVNCQDQFEVTVSSGQTIPTICGENSGQHIFVDLGNNPSDSATIAFSFDGASNTRAWDIKVTQYKCGDENAPPSGCLQYHTTLTGRIKTFNYDLANDNHIPNQQYSVCVRQENGYCCVQYTVCPNEESGFTLSGPAVGEMSKIDSWCATEDYIAIPDSSSTCNQTPGTGPLVNRYCGEFLNDLKGQEANIPICDCTPPHTVDIFTNMMADASAGPVSKGVCLDYTQIPCTG